jgi:hypothetical protein
MFQEAQMAADLAVEKLQTASVPIAIPLGKAESYGLSRSSGRLIAKSEIGKDGSRQRSRTGFTAQNAHDRQPYGQLRMVLVDPEVGKSGISKRRIGRRYIATLIVRSPGAAQYPIGCILQHR